MPVELLLMISTHLDNDDLRTLVLASRSIGRSLLPEYLHRCGLEANDTSEGGSEVTLHEPSGYASLGLWSAIHTFKPPEKMFCSIPCSPLEARTAMRFLTRFLIEPSNTRNLRDFHLLLHGSDPLLLASGFIKMHQLFNTLPLTRLHFAGFGSVDCLPSSIALRSGACSSHTINLLDISSDYAFAPGIAETTMGILKHSPIESLFLCIVSLKPSHWTALLGELNMTSLEKLVLEGDIPGPALIRFLTKHKGLKSIRIQCNVPLDRIRPSRQPFLPNLLTLCAPLGICCDIGERLGNSTSLYNLEVEMSQFQPHDPTFLRLLQIVSHFQNLDHLGLRILPTLPSASPHTNLSHYDSDGYPTRELRQIRTLSWFLNQACLSHRDMV